MTDTFKSEPVIEVEPAQGEFCKCCGGENDVWSISIGYTIGDRNTYVVRSLLCHEHRAFLYGELAPSL